VILVGFRGHDKRNDLAQEVVALLDVRRITGQTFVAAIKCGVHVVVLVRGDPVVVGNRVVSEIGEQLLQGA